MRFFGTVFVVCLVACRVPGAPHDPLMGHPTVISSRTDVDKLAGSYVYVEGRFISDRGIHGWLELPSHVRLFLPDLKERLRGMPWTTYDGRGVRIGGVLKSQTAGIPGYEGPSINVNYFYVFP